jgi:hypothetical protein
VICSASSRVSLGAHRRPAGFFFFFFFFFPFAFLEAGKMMLLAV